MLPASVIDAIGFLGHESPTGVTRKAVMAYATLKALIHYYPDRVTPEVTEIYQKFNWLESFEPSRIIKQKRIMSWQLSREIGTHNEPECF